MGKKGPEEQQHHHIDAVCSNKSESANCEKTDTPNSDQQRTNEVGPYECNVPLGIPRDLKGFQEVEETVNDTGCHSLKKSKERKLDDNVEKSEERKRDEPLRLCKLITKRPILCFVLFFSCSIGMIIISVALFVCEYDIFPVDFENLPLEINDQPWRARELAWTYKNEYQNYYHRTHYAGYRMVSYPKANIDLYYDGKGENVFTKERLKKIQLIEQALTSDRAYQTEFCQLTTERQMCESPFSILRYFDGSYASVSPVFNDTGFNNVSAVLFEAYTNNATKADFQFFLGKGHITQDSSFSPITRSIIPIGYPIQGIDNVDKYEETTKLFQKERLKPILQSARQNYDSFEFSYRSDILWLDEVFEQAKKDVFWAVGSICFIFIFILFHTKSLWITGFSVFSIVSSFVITNLIYRVVFDFRYLGYFHILTIFIVLGIGADDIFVFYGIWRNTASETYPSLAHRLSDTYRKSVFSMFYTSITTAVAFFASSVSPLLATRSFGVFSGLVVMVNYISVILFFPIVVVLYHNHFEKFQWPCISSCKESLKRNCKTNNLLKMRHMQTINKNGTLFLRITPRSLYKREHEMPTNVDQRIQSHAVLGDQQVESTNKDTDNTDFELLSENIDRAFSMPELNTDVSQDNNLQNITPHKKQKNTSCMVRFFRDKYFSCITHQVFRWIFLILIAGVLIFFTVQASKLQSDNEWIQLLKEDHVYSIAQRHSVDSFVQSNADRTLNIFIVWGMNPNDMKDCHFSVPNCKGNRVWDTTFNPSSPAAQLAVQSMCKKMFSWTEAEAKEYSVKKDFKTGQYEINCYINSLDTFMKMEPSMKGTNWTLPYSYSKTLKFMNDRQNFYNLSGFNSSYKHHLEIAISYWLSNRYTFDYTDDFYLFNDLIGEEVGQFSSPLKTDTSRIYGNNIKYIAIQVNTTLKIQNLGYLEGLPVMDRWEDFVTKEMNNMPFGMKNGFQTTQFVWHWLIVTKMLVTNAISGLIIGVCLALPILIIATRNIITGFLATISICCSTICVVGVIPLVGWKLGVLESLNMCMVVGLTVDYVVHLAEGYTQSPHKDRHSRLRDMLEDMAGSIFFGACTTLGASIFMFMTQLSFFQQFGIFMFSTIGFSFLFSMGMFVTLLGICGPQDDTGNILVAFRKMFAKCKWQRKIHPLSTEKDVSAATSKSSKENASKNKN